MTALKELLKNDVINPDGLTDKESYFLSVLFDEHKGNVLSAMKASGLDKEISVYHIRKKLKTQIAEASRDYLSSSSARAAVMLVDVLDNPETPGTKNVLTAAKEILDRGGVFKEESPQVKQEHYVFILPAKDTPMISDATVSVDDSRVISVLSEPPEDYIEYDESTFGDE